MSAFDSTAFDNTNAFDTNAWDFSAALTVYNRFTDWIIDQPGLTGHTQDRWAQYLISLGYSGNTNDMMYAWLSGLGKTEQNLQDKYDDWATTNLHP